MPVKVIDTRLSKDVEAAFSTLNMYISYNKYVARVHYVYLPRIPFFPKEIARIFVLDTAVCIKLNSDVYDKYIRQLVELLKDSDTKIIIERE